jgi:hypothetical protein
MEKVYPLALIGITIKKADPLVSELTSVLLYCEVEHFDFGSAFFMIIAYSFPQ